MIRGNDLVGDSGLRYIENEVYDSNIEALVSIILYSSVIEGNGRRGVDMSKNKDVGKSNVLYFVC